MTNVAGLASRNRYHVYDWQAGAPYPGELEYLGWSAYGPKNSGHGQRGPTGTRGCVKSVNSDTLVNYGTRHN